MDTAGMTSPRKKNRKKNLMIIVMALLAAVLFHILPTVIFAPVKNSKGKETAERRFTVMVNNTPSIQYDPYDLYYWLKYGDPALFAHPDYATGFSSYLKNTDTSLETDDSNTPFQLSLTGKTAFPENKYTKLPRSMELLMDKLDIKMPFQLARSSEKKTARNDFFPKWTATDGSAIKDLFPDKKEIHAIMQKTKPQSFTVLLLTPGRTADSPPTVKVGKSCGVSALDVQAVTALAAHAGTTADKTAVKKMKYVIVDWGTFNTKEKKQK